MPRLRPRRWVIKARIKCLIGWLLFRSGLFRLFLRGRGVIVAFHRVDDRLKGNPISCTRREFQEYCDFFARHFRVLPLTEFLRRLRSGESVARCLVITFDDGYRDNYRVAAPLLRARGLPACFFIATGLIGSETRTWWDAEYGVPSAWMTWDEVRSLKVQGFEIGTHTINHVDLSRTPLPRARREIVGARRQLRRQGIPTALFSYPYGRPSQISPEVRALTRKAGLACCLSAYGGTVRPRDDPFELRRATINPWLISPSHFGFELLFRS